MGRPPHHARSSSRALAAIVALALAGPSCALADNLLGRNTAALLGGPARAPGHVERPLVPDARLAVVWIGHATALVQIEDRVVLTDPVLTRTIAVLGARLVAPGIEAERLPPIDAVLISHMHLDHLSFGSLEAIAAKTRALVVPEGGLVYIPDLGFPAHELGRWQSWEADGLRITAVPVQHSGFRYGADAGWMTATFTGYIIEYKGVTVYFPGDTGYVRAFFRETARRFPRIDLALLPIAPIEPRAIMRHNHLDPEEALSTFEDLGARWMVPVHHGTFVSTFDRPGDALRALRAGMARRGLDGSRVLVLGQGEQHVFLRR